MTQAIPPDAIPETPCNLRHLLEGKEFAALNLGDILESATGPEDAITLIVRSALADETIAAGLLVRMAEIEGEYDRFEERAEAKRRLALRIMEQAGIDRLVAPGLTIDIRRSHDTVVIEDEALVPDGYKIPQPAWVDYQKVSVALKRGIIVPGAVLDDGELSLFVCIE